MPGPRSSSASATSRSCGRLTRGPAHLELGAALTLAELERDLAGSVPLLDAVLPQFASPLIRNAATVGGNLATGSPIGDLAPALLALEATVVLHGPTGERLVPLAEYFTGYRRERASSATSSSVRVRIPLPLSEVTAFHKVAKRRFDDISSVAVGIALDVRDGVVERARIGVGGIAATPVRATATESALEGRPWTPETARSAGEVLRQEGTPDRRPPGQRRLPPGHARHLPCCGCTPTARHRHPRRCGREPPPVRC